jgi:hypothetical protein
MESGDPDAKELEIALECPFPQKQLRRVRLTRFVGMPLEVLDLCWTNDRGACVWDPKLKTVTLKLLPSQRKRLVELKRSFANAKAFARVAAAAAASDLIPHRMSFGKRTDFRLFRVGRMNAPYTQGVLTRFAGVLARPTYEHDYAEIRQAKSSTGKKSGPKKKGSANAQTVAVAA